ncbi:tellurite resistance TerB family protein [Xanthobacter versatilis]|uniref:tellurite resistance TerB family protein n=1 Tax=Xanthobacter autotrophicus (strain ATCC BAA-1158 / Py2) TaxID=78245 RepID=UPI00372C79D9
MADAGSLLGQLIGAALGNGSVRGGGGAGGAGLDQILKSVLEGAGQGGRGAPSGQSGGLPGGLGDILGQVLGGGASGGGRPQGGASGLPGGLGDILGQVLGGGGQRPGGTGDSGGAPAGLPGGLGDILGQILGGGSAPAGGGISGGSTGGSLGDLAEASLGGPPTTSAPNPYPAPAPSPAPAPAPQSGGGSGDLVKYGGMAVIGMLAWNAFRKWQSQSGGRSAFTSGTPEAAGFSPAAAPGGADAFSGVLLSAMAAAAQADGQIDQEELERITGGLSRFGAAAPEREALITFLTTPVDPQQVVDAATSPEAALQIYAASAMAIRPDSAAEKQYLASLASALNLDPGLKAQLDADLNA